MDDAAYLRFNEQFRETYQHMLAYLPEGVFWFPPLPPYFTGYPEGILWDWDQYFEAIALFYSGFPTDYIRNAVKIYLSRQKESGLIERSVPRGGGECYIKHRVHFKPFLAQMALLCHHVDGELNWLNKDDRYERLKKYLVYWLKDMDVRGAGLSVWQEAGHTGMDNHYERAGEWGKEQFFCEGVDLNVYIVRECRAMAAIAEVLKKPADKRLFLSWAKQRTDAIQRDLWNEKDGLYYDFHATKKSRIDVKYVGAFLPLWADIPTKAQANRLVREHLVNPKEFWRPYPIASLAATEPGYVEGFIEGQSTGCCSWRAHTWVPTNYMVFHGLRAYGFNKVAEDLAFLTWKMFMRGRFNEYYSSESGIGTGRKPFWGWTCLALFMPHELKRGIDPTSLKAKSPAFRDMQKLVREVTA